MSESGVYSERAHLVALLAALYPSTWNFSDPENPEWPVVYVQLPTGQASWHIDPVDWWMFGGVKKDPAVQWDGHSTRAKYRRITALTLQIVKGTLPRPPTPERTPDDEHHP